MPKNINILPDTNIVLRYLLRDIPGQFEQAAEIFEQIRTGKKRMVLLESVLVECIYILTKYYKVPKKEVAEALAGLLQYKGVVNRDKGALSAALVFYRDNNLDPVDCVLLAKAKHDEMQVFSFDKALTKAAAKTVSGDVQ
jgi:predicted nucleic-acid-binding protein